MKRSSLLILAMFIFLSAFSQNIKVIKATKQRLNHGRGGASVNYMIEFKKKSKAEITIDSVVSIASPKKILIMVSKINADGQTENTIPENKIAAEEAGIFHIYFGHTLEGPECKGCKRLEPEQFNFSKGVIIYYHSNGVSKKVKVTKFAELSVINAP